MTYQNASNHLSIQFSAAREEPLLKVVSGCLWRLSAHALLWTFGSRQEDSYSLHAERDFWSWCGKGEPIGYALESELTAIKLKIDQRVFLSPSRRKLEINLVQSNYHIEITPRCVRRAHCEHFVEYILVKPEIMTESLSKRFSRRLPKPNRST